ncbi:hypothetical protein [Actinophytocola sp.]|uniref:WD40/YVTN/BNR-like repeat-containing protein n=1 Tax=Actinophytocola sp. TaxID=1872138 RepID=UPI002D801E60|nr:hypothetical protein [Actinophytocola sp.]HET9139644.1 hypothetical protein [Actinophytocola sp.]
MPDREWFTALHQSSYRRVVLIAYALTADLDAAQSGTRAAFARAYARDRAEDWIRAAAIRAATRRRIWHRVLRRTPDEPPHDPVQVLRHAGLPAEEIASRLDIPVETVRSRLDATDPGLAALDAAIHVPSVGVLIQRSRQRTARLRMQAGAGVAVLVVAAVIPALRTPLERPPEAEPAAPMSVEPIPPEPPRVYNLRFGDRQHGYALRTSCPRPDDLTSCFDDLLVTEDSRRWSARSLPPTDRSSPDASWMLHALGRHRLVVETPRSRWFSEDAGRNWHRVPVDPAQSIPAIPAGAVLQARCAVVVSFCHQPGTLVVLLPDSGRAATLANPPPLTEVRPGAVPAADGGWWVSGRDQATGQWAVAVSRDDGRTWSVSPLPPFTGTPFGGPTITTGPGTVYATVTGVRRNVKNGLLAIFRSTDGGRTWAQTWQAMRGQEPRSIAGVAIAAANGTLTVITEAGNHYVSADGGRTFTGGDPAQTSVEWSRGGYFASHTYPSNLFLWSPDGVSWTEFLVGW